MGKIANSIEDLIGKTPLIALHKYENQIGFDGRLLAKLEYFNPTGSVKDRIAKEMIESAENDGRLKPGGTIIEATSGNTGIGLAAIGVAKGYKVVIVMPDNVSIERRKILQAYGAEVVLTPGELNMGGANAKAAEILESLENAILTGQGGNPNNPLAHEKTTGPEIWNDTDGNVDIFVTTVGTGGTISGTGKYLKDKNPNLQIIGVEPAGCPVLSGGEAGPHKIQGIGGGSIAPVTNMDIINEIITVADEDAYAIVREAAALEGLFVGISAGAVLWAVLEVAKRPENKGKSIVTIFPDSGERYLSTDLFDE
jgi:cysteine synthase A